MDITSYLLGKKAGGTGPTPTYQNKEVTITSNGETQVKPDTGYDALKKVDITTNVQPTLENKSVAISTNGTTTINKSSNYDGINSVEVVTNVQPVLENKSVAISTNGTTTVTKSANKDGINSVEIVTNVQPALQSKSVTISSNTTTTIYKDSGYDGMSSVEVTTDIPIPTFETETKSVTITENGTTTVNKSSNKDGMTSVEIITNVSGGAQEAEKKDVNFYDHEGFRHYSYTKTEFLALNAMPANPEKTGLVAQGWNWTLADAKTYVTANGILDIGQLYKTNDNALRIYVKLTPATLQPYLWLPNTNGTIDWGDGSEIETKSANYVKHTYSQAGDYIIKFYPNNDVTRIQIPGVNNSGTSLLAYDPSVPLSYTNQEYRNVIEKIEFCDLPIYSEVGDGIDGMFNLKSMSFPDNSLTLYNSTFRKLRSMKCLVLPKTLAGLYGALFSVQLAEDMSLETVCFSPATIKTTNCNKLYSLKRLTFPTNTQVGSWEDVVFLEEVALPTDSSITSTPQTFVLRNEKLQTLIIPANYTTISAYTISGANTLRKVIFEGNITSIGAQAVYNSYPYLYDFRNCTAVPTISSNALGYLSNYTKIVVPDSLYEDWIADSSWSSYSSLIVKASDYTG